MAPPDKYEALWLSHSSISDFLECPRLYYLKNVYKNPKTRRKISIIKPPLALGQVIHNIIELLSRTPTEKRFVEPLSELFDRLWKNVNGIRGGFENPKEEADYRARGLLMLKTMTENPRPLARPAIKIREELPYYWFSETEKIILCGKIDWLEYFPESNSVGIIDFKTGKRDEKKDSLQLPIYYLVASHCQSRSITESAYWYLERQQKPTSVPLPDIGVTEKQIKEIATRIALARKLNLFTCSRDQKHGCFACAPLEAVIRGEGKFVGLNDYGQEIYILSPDAASLDK